MDVVVTGCFIDKRGVKVTKLRAVLFSLECPYCQDEFTYRHAIRTRTIKDLGVDEPAELLLEHSYHRCSGCKRFFNPPLHPYVGQIDRCGYTLRAREMAKELRDRGRTLKEISQKLLETYHLDVTVTTIHEWLVRLS